MKNITTKYTYTNIFMKLVFASVVFMFVVAPNVSAWEDDGYVDNYVGGDMYDYFPSDDLVGSYGNEYANNYVGGDVYGTYVYTNTYSDNYVGGDIYDASVYSDVYTDNYVGGDIYDATPYEYTDNYVGGDIYDTPETTVVVEEEIEDVYTTTYYPSYEPSYAYAYTPSSGYSTLAYGYSSGYSYSYPSYSYSSPTYTYPTYTYPTYTSPTRPVCTLTAEDNSIDDNDSTTLRWTTDNATSVSINGGVGSVSLDGSRVVSPNDTITYVLVATGSGGSTYCSETVTVDEDDNDNDVQCDSFTVSDSRVDEGDRVTLTWRTTGADDVDINRGVGDVENDGDVRVTIDNDTTYTLTARNGNDTDTCRVTVKVDEDDDNDSNIPRCTLRISDTIISSGQSVTLSWDNLRTDRIIIRDNHGKEIADSRDDRNVDEDSDSIVVRPTRSTDYTLTAYNGNKTRTCTVGTDVDGVTVTSVRSQDTISLAQVPYTGFEAGPVLTAIFYGAIVLWGLVLGYVLVFRKRAHVVARETATIPTFAHILETPATTEVTEEIAEGNPSFIPANLPTEDMEVVREVDSLATLEEHAHANGTLVSSDALRFIESQRGTVAEQIETLDRIIALAKTRFPKEGDWMVLNKERVITILS